MLEFVGGMVVAALITGNVFSLGAAVGLAAFAVFSEGILAYKLISKLRSKNRKRFATKGTTFKAIAKNLINEDKLSARTILSKFKNKKNG